MVQRWECEEKTPPASPEGVVPDFQGGVVEAQGHSTEQFQLHDGRSLHCKAEGSVQMKKTLWESGVSV